MPRSYETSSIIASLFFDFTIVKMKGPNNKLLKLKKKLFNERFIIFLTEIKNKFSERNNNPNESFINEAIACWFLDFKLTR